MCNKTKILIYTKFFYIKGLTKRLTDMLITEQKLHWKYLSYLSIVKHIIVPIDTYETNSLTTDAIAQPNDPKRHG